MADEIKINEMQGGKLIVEREQLYAILPDGRKVYIYAEVSNGFPYLVFEDDRDF